MQPQLTRASSSTRITRASTPRNRRRPDEPRRPCSPRTPRPTSIEQPACSLHPRCGEQAGCLTARAHRHPGTDAGTCARQCPVVSDRLSCPYPLSNWIVTQRSGHVHWVRQSKTKREATAWSALTAAATPGVDTPGHAGPGCAGPGSVRSPAVAADRVPRPVEVTHLSGLRCSASGRSATGLTTTAGATKPATSATWAATAGVGQLRRAAGATPSWSRPAQLGDSK